MSDEQSRAYWIERVIRQEGPSLGCAEVLAVEPMVLTKGMAKHQRMRGSGESKTQESKSCSWQAEFDGRVNRQLSYVSIGNDAAVLYMHASRSLIVRI